MQMDVDISNIGSMNINFVKYQSRGTFGQVSSLKGAKSFDGTLAPLSIRFSVRFANVLPVIPTDQRWERQPASCQPFFNHNFHFQFLTIISYFLTKIVLDPYPHPTPPSENKAHPTLLSWG